MDQVGIGMVGSGFMGLTYSEAIARHVQGARLAAVAGGSRAGKLAADYGVPAEPSVEALLARMEAEMRSAAKELEFERAAALRDEIQQVRDRVLEQDAGLDVSELGGLRQVG